MNFEDSNIFDYSFRNGKAQLNVNSDSIELTVEELQEMIDIIEGE